MSFGMSILHPTLPVPSMRNMELFPKILNDKQFKKCPFNHDKRVDY